MTVSAEASQSRNPEIPAYGGPIRSVDYAAQEVAAAAEQINAAARKVNAILDHLQKLLGLGLG